MTEDYQNKYRTQSQRMTQWDYSANGVCFVTLVTQNRACNLGKIVKTHGHSNQPMAYIKLSGFGKIVKNEWLKSFEIRNEIFLDEYTIMPNHLHAVIVSEPPQSNDLHAGMLGLVSLAPKVVRISKAISSFIACFKKTINSKIDNYIDEFGLHIPRYSSCNQFFEQDYHDHIIQNEAEMKSIKEYIANNPLKWINDVFNPCNFET